MIREATAIHTTYPEYLNTELRNLIFREGMNPFLAECFQQVDSQELREKVISGDPCVIVSTSGMLNGGPVMEYLLNLAQDEKNALVFVGYQVEERYGRRIQKGWREVPMGRKGAITINLEIVTIDGFSGHSDRRQLDELHRPDPAEAREDFLYSWRREQYHRSRKFHLQAVSHRDALAHEP